MEKTIRTVCQACHTECGVIVHVLDGNITKVAGDPNHPMSREFICVKGKSGPERLAYIIVIESNFPSDAPEKEATVTSSRSDL